MSGVGGSGFMTARKKIWLKRIAIFVVASFIMGGLFKLIYHLDSDKQVVEDFLWESAYLKFVIGELEQIQIRRITNFHGTEDQRPYKDYLYYLKGSKKRRICKRTLLLRL
jgi:uncharacterized protein YqhQ